MKPQVISDIRVFVCLDGTDGILTFIDEAEQELILRRGTVYDTHNNLLAIYQPTSNNKHP